MHVDTPDSSHAACLDREIRYVDGLAVPCYAGELVLPRGVTATVNGPGWTREVTLVGRAEVLTIRE